MHESTDPEFEGSAGDTSTEPAIPNVTPLPPIIVEGEEGPIALLDLEVSYPPKLSEEEVSFVAGTRSLPEPPVADVNLEVPFIHQLWDTPNWFDGHWACGPTSATMVLAYYGLLEPKPMTVTVPYDHHSEYGWYLPNAFTHQGRPFTARAATPHGSAQGIYGMVLDHVPGIGWCAVWHNPATGKGMKVLMDTVLPAVGNRVDLVEPSEEGLKATLDAGHPAILSGKLFGWHHLIVVRGYYYDARLKLYGWIVNDPFGYRTDSSYDGTNVVYLWREMNAKYMYLFSGPHLPT